MEDAGCQREHFISWKMRYSADERCCDSLGKELAGQFRVPHLLNMHFLINPLVVQLIKVEQILQILRGNDLAVGLYVDWPGNIQDLLDESGGKDDDAIHRSAKLIIITVHDNFGRGGKVGRDIRVAHPKVWNGPPFGIGHWSALADDFRIDDWVGRRAYVTVVFFVFSNVCQLYRPGMRPIQNQFAELPGKATCSAQFRTVHRLDQERTLLIDAQQPC